MKKQTDFFGADVAIEAVGAEADGAFFQHCHGVQAEAAGRRFPVALNWAIDSVPQGRDDLRRRRLRPLFSNVKMGDLMNKGLTPCTRTRRR
jgi:alcohol dehydrogenase